MKNRIRDYHTDNNILPGSDKYKNVCRIYFSKLGSDSNITYKSKVTRPIKNGITSVSIDLYSGKAKTPMHFKLYESTMQTVNILILLL